MIKKLKLLFCLFLVCGCSSEEIYNENKTQIINEEAIITVIDVEQGSSALIQSEDEAILIDAGESNQADKVLTKLNELKVDELKAVIATHPHSDHIGGISKVIENVKVKTLYLPNKVNTSVIYESMLDTAEKENVKVKVPKPKDTVSVGSGEMQFLAPASSADFGDNLNTYSIVTRFTFGDFSYLTGGDLDGAGLDSFLESNPSITASIFQAFHHGSFNDTNPASFLDTLNPSAILISCGVNNMYGHPHQELLDYIKTHGKTSFRTDSNGTITVKVKEGNYSITTAKELLVENNTVPNEVFSGHVIANKNTKKYHKDICTNLPLEKNREYFSSEQEAIAAGYVASKDCFH